MIADEATKEAVASATPEEMVANEESYEDLPPADRQAIDQVIRAVELQSIELLGAYFDRVGAGSPATASSTFVPSGIGINPEWEVDGQTLKCLFTFRVQFGEEHASFDLIGRFQVLYAMAEGSLLDDHMLEQFTLWNAVFNVWPYWREFVASILSRTSLPPFTVELLKMPAGPAVGKHSNSAI